MIRVIRRQLGRTTTKKPNEHLLDCTAKSAHTRLGMWLSPTWTMVMDYKNGDIGEDLYTKEYMQTLKKNYAAIDSSIPMIKEKLAANGEDTLVLLCYCKDKDFCHTYLAIDWLINHWPDVFTK